MSSYDFTDAGTLIPQGTIAAIELKIRPGGAGEDGLLKRSADGQAEMLDVEYTVVDEGEHARRKIWEHYVLSGTMPGHGKAGEISRSKLRAILESARGIMPSDVSAAARAKRTVSLKDFDGMRFIGRIGVETGRTGNDGKTYPERNTLLTAITPDRAEWRQVEQIAKPVVLPSAIAEVIKPAWGR